MNAMSMHIVQLGSFLTREVKQNMDVFRLLRQKKLVLKQQKLPKILFIKYLGKKFAESNEKADL
jgi:hypothetical protein